MPTEKELLASALMSILNELIVLRQSAADAQWAIAHLVAEQSPEARKSLEKSVKAFEETSNLKQCLELIHKLVNPNDE